MSRLVIVCLFALTGCFQAMNSDDDLRVVPVTNNPHVVPNHGGGFPGFGGNSQGPY